MGVQNGTLELVKMNKYFISYQVRGSLKFVCYLQYLHAFVCYLQASRVLARGSTAIYSASALWCSAGQLSSAQLSLAQVFRVVASFLYAIYST